MPLCAVTHYCGGLADPPDGTDLDERSILSARPGDVCVVYRDHSASAVLLYMSLSCTCINLRLCCGEKLLMPYSRVDRAVVIRLGSCLCWRRRVYVGYILT
jgi:hypothetical protein